MRFVTNLNLNQNQLINGTFEVLASDPNTGNFDGRLIFNSTEGTIKVYDDTLGGWRKMLTGVQSGGANSSSLTINESNGVVTITPNLATSASAGLMSASDFSKLSDATDAATASKLVLRDASSQAKFGTPTEATHAATKGYVDSVRSGLDVKQSVRAATTETVNLATELVDGSIIDGVTLALGDRILVKDQGAGGAAHVDNGIYTVNISGAPTRAGDFDQNDEVSAGAFTFVEEGTAYGDSGWVVSTNGTINIGVTGIQFAQFSGTGQIVAGDALEKDGSTLNVKVDGLSLEVYSDELRIADGAAGNGLSASVGVLSVNTSATGGVELVDDNLQIKIKSSVDGLATDGDGLYLTSDIAGDGLGFTDGVVDVKVKSTGGIELDTDELAIKLNASVEGLTTDANGLALASGVAGTGLTFTDGVLSVDAVDLTASVGNGISGILAIANGGTNASDETNARYNLAQQSGDSAGRTTTAPVLARIVTQVIGDDESIDFDVYHNLNTRAVIVQVFDSNTYDTVICDVARPTANKVNLGFSVAPTSGEYTVVISGYDTAWDV